MKSNRREWHLGVNRLTNDRRRSPLLGRPTSSALSVTRREALPRVDIPARGFSFGEVRTNRPQAEFVESSPTHDGTGYVVKRGATPLPVAVVEHATESTCERPTARRWLSTIAADSLPTPVRGKGGLFGRRLPLASAGLVFSSAFAFSSSEAT